MRNIGWVLIASLGGWLLIKKRYKIMNMLLTVAMIRKLIVVTGMRIPFLRHQLIHHVAQPTK